MKWQPTRLESAMQRAAQVRAVLERNPRGNTAIEVLDCISLADEVLRLRDLLAPKRHPMEGGMVSGGGVADLVPVSSEEKLSNG